MDEPLREGNWPLLSASVPCPMVSRTQTPREMTAAPTWDTVTRCLCGLATQRAAEAGFDMAGTALRPRLPAVQLHLSPLTNQRTDVFGGSIENRCALSAARCSSRDARGLAGRPADQRAHLELPRLGPWRQHRQTTRSWLARLFKAAGADIIDVSSGQTTRHTRPVYGRMYQTPFSDRIRNEVGVPHDRGGCHQRGRPREHASLAPPVPTCVPWPGPIWPTRPGRCTKRPAWKAATSTGPAPI
jgi:anthraniloyl-CoA monooxygenase